MYDAGFTVVVITTDLGPSNSALWKGFNAAIPNKQITSFVHPQNPDLNIFVFTDPLHLLNLIRNNFVDSDFHYIKKS